MDLRAWMIENRWTQTQLSKKVGISRPTMQSVLEKKKKVSFESAYKIVQFTKGQVTFEDLAREDNKNDESDKNRH